MESRLPSQSIGLSAVFAEASIVAISLDAPVLGLVDMRGFVWEVSLPIALFTMALGGTLMCLRGAAVVALARGRVGVVADPLEKLLGLTAVSFCFLVFVETFLLTLLLGPGWALTGPLTFAIASPFVALPAALSPRFDRELLARMLPALSAASLLLGAIGLATGVWQPGVANWQDIAILAAWALACLVTLLPHARSRRHSAPLRH